MRSRLLPIVAIALFLLASARAAESRPNVLLICVDDLKPLLGCYGDKTVLSPNIDRLAARGLLFDKAFCNQAVCSPSRNALMLGIRPQTIGIYDLPTNFRKAVPDAVTLAQHFKLNGYRTESMGKIFHVGHGNTEDAASWQIPHWRPAAPMYASKESQEAMRKARAAIKAAGKDTRPGNEPKGPPTECADVPDTSYADGQIADEAIRRLQSAKAKPGEPFFIAVGFIKPHLPFCAPKKYWDLYKRDQFKLPAQTTLPQGAPAMAGHTSGELRQYTDVPAVGPVDDARARELIHGYHAAVSYMDAQLGRVLDALDETGLAKSTIVAFWGDHGWHLGDHGLWCKHTNFEQAAKIPFIVAAPGVTRPGTRTGALVESVDLYPSLCELAGLPVPKGIDGASFVPVLKDPSAKTKNAVFHIFPRGPILGRAVRTDRYRLVEWKKPGAAPSTAVYELYDYEADPLETRNWASEKTEQAEQLKAILARQPEAKPQIKALAEAKGSAGRGGKK